MEICNRVWQWERMQHFRVEMDLYTQHKDVLQNLLTFSNAFLDFGFTVDACGRIRMIAALFTKANRAINETI